MAGKDDKMERSDIETIANVDHSHSVKGYFRYDEFLQSGGGGGVAASGWGSPAKGASWGGTGENAGTTAPKEENCNEEGAWGTSRLNLGIVKAPVEFDWPPPGAAKVQQQQPPPKPDEVSENFAVVKPDEADAGPVNAAKNQLNQLRDALYAYDGWGKDHVNQETQWDIAVSPTKSLEVSGGVAAPTGTELWHDNLAKGGQQVAQQPPDDNRGTSSWDHVPSSNFGGTWGENSEVDTSSVWSKPAQRDPFTWGPPEAQQQVNKATVTIGTAPQTPAEPDALGSGGIWATDGPATPGGATTPSGAWNDTRTDSMIRGGVSGRLNLMDNPSKGAWEDPLLPPPSTTTSFWSQPPVQPVQPPPTGGGAGGTWNHDIPDVRARMQPPPNIPERFAAASAGKPDGGNPWNTGAKNGLWDQMDRAVPPPPQENLWGNKGNKSVWPDPGDFRNWQPNGQHFPNGMNKYASGGAGNTRMGVTIKVQEIIRSSKQFRLMSTMGYKAEDIETALQMTNMNMDEAVELLGQTQQRNKFGGGDFGEPGRALSGRFPPQQAHPHQTINGGLDNAQLLHLQKYLTQTSNNPLASQGAAGGGINLTQLQAANQTTEPSIHQLRALVQQIEMAVQAGYLNSQILNQPLSPHNLQLLSQLLNNIKHLPAPQNQASSQPSVFNKQQSVADFQRAQQQFDPIGSLQGNFSDMALNKVLSQQQQPNQKMPFVPSTLPTSQVQSRLNQWKLPPSASTDNDMANFSRAPGTSTKPPHLSMNFSMNYEGPWSSEPNNTSDGWPDIPEFEPGKPWKVSY